ncbi:hypothetical protein ABTB76_19840, partial [Acinetobacter baumannii]
EEELGKQAIVADENLKRGGDWKRLESALGALETQSVLIYRSVNPCHRWGESTPDLLWKERQSSSHSGTVYYKDFSF